MSVMIRRGYSAARKLVTVQFHIGTALSAPFPVCVYID